MSKKCILFFILLLFLSITVISQEKYNITLREALDGALKNNPKITSFKELINSKKAEKKHIWLPEDLVIVSENERIPIGAPVKDAVVKKYGIVQKIDFPYKLYLKFKNSGEVLKSLEERLKILHLDVIYDISVTFHRIEMLNLITDYLQQNLEILKDFLEKSEKKYEVGEIAYLEVLKSRVEMQRGKTELENFRNSLRLEYEKLNYLMFSDEQINASVSSRLSYEPLKLDIGGCKNQALNSHPVISEIQYLVNSASIGKSLAKWEIIPDISLGYLKQKVAGEKYWVFKAEASLPIWFPFKNRNKIAEKNHDYKSMEIEYENVKRKLELEIDNAANDLNTAQKNVNLYKEGILKESEEIYEKAVKGYEEGEYGYLDLLEAQRTLIKMRIEYAEILFEYKLSVLKLKKALNLFDFI